MHGGVWNIMLGGWWSVGHLFGGGGGGGRCIILVEWSWVAMTGDEWE